MTTQTLDVQSTNRTPKSNLEPCFRTFSVLNFLPPHIMGKPNKLATGMLIGALATSANAKEGELKLALNENRSDTPTQYGGGSDKQRHVEATTLDFEAQIADLMTKLEGISCEGKKGMVRLKCRGKVRGLEAQIKSVKLDQELAEQAQRIEKKQVTKSELAQENQVKRDSNSEKDKTIEDQNLSIAALKALKKVAKEQDKD